MRTGRSATSIIWNTVVVAGAMLAVPGCLGGGGTRTVCDPPDQVAAEPATAPTPDEVVSTGEPAAGDTQITVMVMSSPSGAAVHVDDRLVGVTPVAIPLPSGDREVTIGLALEGYTAEQRLVRADRDQEIAVTLGEAVASRPRCHEVPTGRGFVLS